MRKGRRRLLWRLWCIKLVSLNRGRRLFFFHCQKRTKKSRPSLPKDLKNRHLTKIRKLAALKHTNFLRKATVFHPAERLFPEMAEGTGRTNFVPCFRPQRPLRQPPFRRMEAGLTCVKKSALFERSEFADFSKGGLFPRRMPYRS